MIGATYPRFLKIIMEIYPYTSYMKIYPFHKVLINYFQIKLFYTTSIQKKFNRAYYNKQLEMARNLLIIKVMNNY
jgi:hypothetical protein